MFHFDALLVIRKTRMSKFYKNIDFDSFKIIIRMRKFYQTCKFLLKPLNFKFFFSKKQKGKKIAAMYMYARKRKKITN